MSHSGDCRKMNLPLYTQRLTIRDFRDEDYDDLYELRVHPECCRYIRPAMTPEQLREHLISRKRPWIFADNTWFSMGVFEHGSERLIGELVFRYESMADRRAEIGYCFHPDVWGRGFAFEAVDAMTCVLFEQLDCHKLSAYFDPANAASRKLLDRLGCHDEGVRLQHYYVWERWNDSQTYGLLRSNYTVSRGKLLDGPPK